MNLNKYIFLQLVDFLPYDDFNYIVRKYNGNKGVRNFSCWNQLLKMIFGQLSNCDSLIIMGRLLRLTSSACNNRLQADSNDKLE